MTVTTIQGITFYATRPYSIGFERLGKTCVYRVYELDAVIGLRAYHRRPGERQAARIARERAEARRQWQS